jgi:hypothetical protein
MSQRIHGSSFRLLGKVDRVTAGLKAKEEATEDRLLTLTSDLDLERRRVLKKSRYLVNIKRTIGRALSSHIGEMRVLVGTLCGDSRGVENKTAPTTFSVVTEFGLLAAKVCSSQPAR